MPGAVSLPYTDLQDAQGRLLSLPQLRERIAAAAPEGRRIVTSCGSGLTACVLALGAHLAGREQVWTAAGWAERFDRGAEDFGFGDGPREVASVRVQDPGLLIGYLRAVCCGTAEYVNGLDDASLDEVVNDSWDPPVTRGVRLISIVDDAIRHLAQGAYVLGMPQRG